jgi:hypothetical protein
MGTLTVSLKLAFVDGATAKTTRPTPAAIKEPRAIGR